MFVFHFTSKKSPLPVEKPKHFQGNFQTFPLAPMGLTTGGVRFSGGFSGTGQRNRSPSQLDAATQSSLDFFFPWHYGWRPKKKTKIKHLKT